MTPSIPVERVESLLVEAGYRRVDTPLHVGSIPFQFAATLVGGKHALDLVVVIDTVTERPDGRILKKVEGLARALDLVGSRRTVSVVLVGPMPGGMTIEAMARVCRVLAVGTPTGTEADQSIRDSLAILLPLGLPVASSQLAEPMTQVVRALGDTYDDVAARLVEAATAGKEQVEAAVGDLLEDVLSFNRGAET